MIKLEKGIKIIDNVRTNGRPLKYPWKAMLPGDSFGMSNSADLKRSLAAAKAYIKRHNLGWEIVWAPEAGGFRLWRRA